MLTATATKTLPLWLSLLRKEPDDDLTKAAFSDWLQEQGPPSKVKTLRNYIPEWLRKAWIDKRKEMSSEQIAKLHPRIERNNRPKNGWWIFNEIDFYCGGKLNRMGETTILGIPAFVSEPYPADEEEREIYLNQLRPVGKLLNLPTAYSTEAAWHPDCVRSIIFHF